MKKEAKENLSFLRASVLICAVLFFFGSCSKAWEDIETSAENPPSSASGSAAALKSSAAFPRESGIRDSGIIEIKEKMFIAQVNDVYINTDDYMGKTIKLEGIFKQEQYEGNEEPYRFVIRYGPGCCGNDGNAGFEIAWANDTKTPYPEVDSWVEAVGVLKTYEEDGDIPFIYLDLASLNVLSKRGAEFVTQ